MAADAPPPRSGPETITSPTDEMFSQSHSRSHSRSTSNTTTATSPPAATTTTTTPPTAPSTTTSPRQPQTQPPKRPRPSLAPILTRLRYPLAPLHPLPLGAPHPHFPPTLLSYHLLTESQLDSLARYYHQHTSPTTAPTVWTYGYPAHMDWDAEFLAYIGEVNGMEARVRVKRRKVGRFIGLRGCETPSEEGSMREAWRARRERLSVKGAGDWGFLGRRGMSG